MPYEGEGQRYSVAATKATAHGKPVVENRHPGFAAKSAQAAPMAVSVANALLAQQIEVGEEMVIMLTGVHEVAVADLPGGAAVGDRIYITLADNVLTTHAIATTGDVLEAAYAKFGIISSIDATLGRALVNLNLRSVF